MGVSVAGLVRLSSIQNLKESNDAKSQCGKNFCWVMKIFNRKSYCNVSISASFVSTKETTNVNNLSSVRLTAYPLILHDHVSVITSFIKRFDYHLVVCFFFSQTIILLWYNWLWWSPRLSQLEWFIRAVKNWQI